MSEQFLNFVRNCSKDSKSRIGLFLNELLSNEKIQTKLQKPQSQKNQFTKLENLFNQISSKFSIERSRQISKNERCKKMLTNHQYNYGQIAFKTIYKIIRNLQKYKQLTQHEIFYDLGSGSGKVIFGAGLCFPFIKCKGIQFLESLYNQSLKLKQKILANHELIEETVNQCSVSEQMSQQYKLPSIEFCNSDFKTQSWNDATVIYVSSTCYTRQVMNQISSLTQSVEKGTILITLTKGLENDDWKVIDKFEGQTSWGICTIYVHQKIVERIKKEESTQTLQ